MTRPLLVILGADGFIGRALRQRCGESFRLLNVDKRPFEAQVAPDEKNLELDMGDPEHIDQLFHHLGREAPVGIIDLVAYYDFKNEPDERYETIERGLEIILDRCRTELPAEMAFIYASSMAALEPTEPGVKLTPESPRSGEWAYTRHKLRCEEILEAANIPQPRVELVLAGVYSEWCELVPLYQQIERVRRLTLEKYFYPGPTDRGFPYVHRDDAAAAFEAAVVACKGRSGVHRFMVSEDRPVTYRQVQDTAAQTFFGKKISVMRVPKFVAREGARFLNGLAALRGGRSFIKPWMIDYAAEHFDLDTSRTLEELGWRPQHDMHQELEAICARAQQDVEQWKALNDARPY